MKKIFAEGKKSTKATFFKDKDASSHPLISQIYRSLTRPTTVGGALFAVVSRFRGAKISTTALPARHLQD